MCTSLFPESNYEENNIGKTYLCFWKAAFAYFKITACILPIFSILLIHMSFLSLIVSDRTSVAFRCIEAKYIGCTRS